MENKEWIPAETLPEIGKEVLVCGTPIGITTGFYWGNNPDKVPSDACKG